MRLWLITSTFPNPWNRTAGAFNLDMAKAWSTDHTVHVLAPVPWTTRRAAALQRPASRDAHGVETVRLDVRHPTYYYPPKMGRPWYGEFFWWSVRATVDQMLATSRPDAVFGYWIHPDGQAAVRVGRLAGVPSVLLVGGSDALLLTRATRRRERIVRVLNSADAIIAVSHHLREQLLRLGIPEEKIHVVYRGVDRQQFTPGCKDEARSRLQFSSQRPALVWAGRMVPVKGLTTLIDACTILARQEFLFDTYLIGDGPLTASLRRRVAEADLQDRIRFVGRMAHEALPDWYRAADQVVLPSYSEGVPNVLLESMACGTPFVASSVGGIPEIATPGLDRLVVAGDIQRLAVSIKEALERPPPSVQRLFAPSCVLDSSSRLTDIAANLRERLLRLGNRAG